jgi:hypothetical protein
MTINDNRILELKKQIEVKKDKLGKSSRFTPITNCSLELEGVRYNINVLNDRNDLTMLMTRLNIYLISATQLGVADEINFSGYHVGEWITDIKSKIAILAKKQEEKALKLMEDKLLKLLSDGKKTELEIDEISSMLNN